MKKVKIEIELFKEEIDTLNKGTGKEIDVFDNGELNIILKYKNEI